jgi:hypothetical protein
MRKVILAAVALSLALVPGAAAAQRIILDVDGVPTEGSYEYLIGLPVSNPDLQYVVMSADNGDRLEVRGAGGFGIPSRRISGAGTFVHTDASGHVIARGAWSAVELVGFAAYGASGASGGRLEMRASLTPEGGTSAMRARMEVDCRLGLPAQSPAFEVRVVLQDSGLSFSRWVQGVTLIYKLHFDPPI